MVNRPTHFSSCPDFFFLFHVFGRALNHWWPAKREGGRTTPGKLNPAWRGLLFSPFSCFLPGCWERKARLVGTCPWKGEGKKNRKVREGRNTNNRLNGTTFYRLCLLATNIYGTIYTFPRLTRKFNIFSKPDNFSNYSPHYGLYFWKVLHAASPRDNNAPQRLSLAK